MTKRKRGFTLIELIAVLVILAILALIVTPLVMNIIKILGICVIININCKIKSHKYFKVKML